MTTLDAGDLAAISSLIDARLAAYGVPTLFEIDSAVGAQFVSLNSTLATSFSGLNSKLDAIDDCVDTEVAAIKAKTDNLPSDPADQSQIAALIAAVSTLVTAIKAKTDLLTSAPITVASPVTPTGSINEIIIGDDYLAEHSRVFEWTVDKPAGFNLVDATCWFGAKLDGNNKWLVDGSIADNGDDTLTLTFELPKASTKLLKPGNYDWSVAVHDVTGNELTRVKSGTNSVTLSKKFTSATS